MKKILALVMAIVMMMAIAVPAFATKSFNQGTDLAVDTTANQTTVKTDISDAGVGTYTVTIPAEISIKWKSSDAVAKDYVIDTQLMTGYTLKVNVSKTADMKNDNGDTLVFNLDGDTTDIVADAVATDTHSINVAVPDWSQASVDNYSGTITFTAEVIAPATT